MDPIRPEFELLDSAGLEYHRWVSDVETTFVAKDFTSTIKPSADAASATEKDKANDFMFLKRHIDPNLRWGMSPGEIEYLVDSATTHTILRNRQLFFDLTPYNTYVITMIGSSQVISGRGTAQFLLPNGTMMKDTEALYAPRAHRTLLSFKDIRANGYHLETHCENGVEYIYVTSSECGRKRILKKLMCHSSGLYITIIRIIESHVVANDELLSSDLYKLWHDRLGHPGRDMMIRVLNNSHGHPFFRMKKKMRQYIVTMQSNNVHSKVNDAHFMPSKVREAQPSSSKVIEAHPLSHSSSLSLSKAHRSFCKACSLAKTVSRPSYAKDTIQNIPFLQRIQGDIGGPIHPECRPFKYFIVLVDASTRWSHVALLSTRNDAFAKLLAQIIRLRAHHPDHPIKFIRLDNAGEFTSKGFDDFCMSKGIDVEHPVPHVHTQNGLVEATIKRLQIIFRALVMRFNLPITAWGYAILHAALLIRFRPTVSQPFSAYQLVTGYEPDISHLRIFGCAIYVPITPPQRTNMGPQR
ncbi:uncharacterized protein LOC113294003 [Papaver somniferum]|uniref:uncharacterized protein LOC113294003 n=1 Tax=Papaver somniferum TaxID=3469 RepID=UPI000E6FA862|nr:uncharacterized protein LOC113294003 [Papaver somniferum]